MRTAVAAAMVAALAGCGTMPQHTVTQLDPDAPAYGSAECRAARQTALAYEDNVPTRMGVGIAAGLLLGPFGIPLALLADAAQAQKRDAVNTEVRKHCEGRRAPQAAQVVDPYSPYYVPK